MTTQTAALGETYYKLIGEGKIEEIKKPLSQDVKFTGPLATLEGKEAVMEATTNFIKSFKSLTIRAKFGNEDQAVIIYDVDIPDISDKFPGVSYLTFKDGLITNIELFYDGSRMMQKKDEIFQ